MRITAIVCTHNRCQSLAVALQSLAEQTLSDAVEWEVLVVDNNSGDGTRKVVAEFGQRFPNRFRYLFEPQPGLSFARNSGIRAARGEIIAFTDDDITADARWLESLNKAFASDWAGVGGRILPPGTFAPPRWLRIHSRHALAPLALLDLGLESGPLKEPPFGANMAFRKTMFERYGDFRTDLGRRPGSLMSNEDTEFGRRLIACGERFHYEPAAVIYHPVPENRMQRRYFLAWWFDKGRADIRQNGIEPERLCFRGIPVIFFRRIALWGLRWLLSINAGERFERKINVWINAGLILECHRLYTRNWRETSGGAEPAPIKSIDQR